MTFDVSESLERQRREFGICSERDCMMPIMSYCTDCRRGAKVCGMHGLQHIMRTGHHHYVNVQLERKKGAQYTADWIGHYFQWELAE